MGEFDTRVMLHAANAVSHSYKCTLIIANDTDIIVLGILLFSDIGADKRWVSFGIGNKLQDQITYMLVFWHVKEMCLRKMEPAARAHSHTLSSDG